MQVAYLIIAHDQPSHLAKLISSLYCDWATFFIHVDKNTDILQFQKIIPKNENVVFLSDKRISVNWGGFSMVKATLNLLYASLHHGSFDRFCLLSGSDYPVRPLSFIKSAFNSDKEFIRIGRRLTDADKNGHLKNVKFRHFIDNPVNTTDPSVKELNTQREIYNKIPLYHGSQWWALTDKSIEFIINYLDQNEDYVNFHEYTLCSDEIFFHSIIKSSPYAPSIAHDFENIDNCESKSPGFEHGCHYIDWLTKGVPLPKVLDVTDASKIFNSGALFARKVREKTSDDLLKILDEKLKK